MKLFLRGRIWWLTQWDGKRQLRISTGCTLKSDAEKKAAELLAPVLVDVEAGRIDKLRDRALELHNDADAIRLGRLSLAGLWDKADYSSRRPGVRPRTLQQVRSFWERFCKFAAARGVIAAADLTEQICTAFIASLPERTAVSAFNYCRLILSFAGIRGEFFVNKPRHQYRHHDPLSREQVAALLAAADRLAALPPSQRCASAASGAVGLFRTSSLRYYSF